MKIAYLTSLYPAVSHTFIMREVLALRARGHDIGTFSVRRAEPADIKGKDAEEEARRTRFLLPPDPRSYARAARWLATRTGLAFDAGRHHALAQASGLRDRAKWAAYYVEAVQLAHVLHSEGYEHLHCHFGNAGSSTGMLAARLAGIPFSITCHGSELNEPEKFRLAQKAREAKALVCVSKFGRARLMHLTEPELWPRFHVVRCGVEGIEESALPEREGPLRIACVARLSPEKGHLVLLDAVSRLRARGLSLRLSLIGEGPARSLIETRIQSLGIQAVVELTGALEPRRVAEHYRAADLVVLASFSEGVPVVLMEAMAHGRPVVATRVGGVQELVIHERTGLTVAPGDADELAQAIRIIADDPARARDMAAAAVELVAREFSVARSAAQLEALFAAP
jgi:glycosyltransferase involved in cell wall biosynthesis